MATVLIIGASRGIGHEFVHQYRADNWDVIGTARDEAGLAKLTALGARTLKLDVNDAGAPAALEAGIAGTKLDVAIFCAGVYGPRSQKLETPTLEEFDSVMRTNVLAAMRLVPVAGRALAGSKGKLAVISSRMASMSLVLGPDGVTCITFHPGWVKTDMGGAGADIDVSTSVSGMRGTLAALQPSQNGSFLNYDGAVLPW